jgi:hypothetical protein
MCNRREDRIRSLREDSGRLLILIDTPVRVRLKNIYINGVSKNNWAMEKNFFMTGKRKILDNQPPTLLFYRLVKQSSKTAEVAQLVEQRPEKPRVRSSILRLGTILSISLL